MTLLSISTLVHGLCQTIWQPSDRGSSYRLGAGGGVADVNNYQSDQFIILLKPATKQKHMWAGVENNDPAIGRSSNIVTSQSYVAYININHRWKRSLIMYSTFKKSTAVGKSRAQHSFPMVSKVLALQLNGIGFYWSSTFLLYRTWFSISVFAKPHNWILSTLPNLNLCNWS